ncbi:MAG: MFS transporter [Rhodospirillaceae bacterium]|nr:MFS transporter [Rhodospirillaceae bacterium]
MTSPESFSPLRVPYVAPVAIGRCSAALSQQIINVAVGWQLYERTGSALSLGLVGLFELAPVVALTLVAGNAADRYSRRNIAIFAQGLLAFAALGLALVAYLDGPVWMIYGLLLAVGTARAFSSASIATVLPQLIDRAHFARASAWMSSAYQFASVVGPALGGLIIAATGGATTAYAAATVGQVVFVACFLRLPALRPEAAPGKRSVADLFAGFTFIRRTPVFLAAITLDMFAVLLGGAVALLPVYAKDILHVGPEGLGWLRAAPAVGSLMMALVQTRIKPWAKPGQALMVAVIGFGLATIGFGIATNFALSAFCLFLTGAFDSVSVVVRLTLEQSLTPDRLRGRVSAINYVFIGFSNEFGTFESGLTAGLFGTVPAVVGGGIGTILVVLAVAATWPQLLRLPPLHTLQPEESAVPEAEIRHAV